jgi:beta-aspartyl-peptidase (threonine type)
MRHALLVLLAAAAMNASAGTPPTAEAMPRTALVIHAGAGVIERSALSADKVLREGGSALDAVGAAVLVLEESPWFNAGKGAVFTADGTHELDAAIMEGHTRRAGAVAGVTTVRNPIRLARAVMEHSNHVMLTAAGAERFADTRPEIERVPNAWFDTDKRREQLEGAKAREQAGHAAAPGTYFGTVGAVALDAQGRLAAATSTGGMTNKRWGRIGDAPVIGAGTWADARCAVSGTGWGEYYIRTAAAHEICARVSLRGDSLATAADAVINTDIPALGGDGGAIAVDADGNIALPFNTSGMYRGWIHPDGRRGTAIFRGD